MREVVGVMLLGEANREAPAQAELRPTCAGAPFRQPAPYLSAYRLKPQAESYSPFGAPEPRSNPENQRVKAQNATNSIFAMPTSECELTWETIAGCDTGRPWH